MAYVVNRYNENVLTVVEDYTVDETLDIKLVGRHYIDYGEIQNENFVFLLENFSNPQPPPRALSGQLWFDSYKNKIKVFDGDRFVPVGIPTVDSQPPYDLDQGELWWDSANEQLYTFNGHEYVLIGPRVEDLESVPFWWDAVNQKLYAVDDGEYILIGPEIDEALALSHIL